MIQLLDRTTGRSGPGRAGDTAATRFMDGAVDGAVLLFAAWTVVYHLGLLIKPSTSALLLMWLVAAAAVAVVYGTRRGWWAAVVWPERSRTERSRTGRSRFSPPRRVLIPVAVVTGIAAGTCAGLHSSGVPWWCAWTTGLVSAAASAACLLPRRPEPPDSGEADSDEIGRALV